MDRIKKLKIKKQDGTFSDYVPIGADAENIDTTDGESVQLKLNKKPYYYNSVADMKADTKLKAGDMAITLGYYEANDGGGAEYKIKSSSDNYYEELNNELIAELIIDDIANIRQYGVSSFNEDNTVQLNKAFQYNTNLEGFMGSINIKGSLIISHTEINYNFKNLTINVTSNETIDKLISIYSSVSQKRIFGVFKNLIIENNGKVNESLCIYDTRRLLFENLRVNGAIQKEIAIKGGKNAHTANVVLKNIRCENGRYNDNTLTQCANCVALFFEGYTSDSYIENFCGVDYSIHIRNGGLNWFNMIHCWNFNYVTNSILFDNYYDIMVDNVYCDTIETLMNVRGNAQAIIDHARFTFYPVQGIENITVKPFVANERFIDSNGRLKISNSVFTNPNSNEANLINLPANTYLDRINAVNITNTYTDTFLIQPFYMEYYEQTLDLDFTDYSLITYISSSTITSSQMVTIKGATLFDIRLYSNTLNLVSGTWTKLCKINGRLVISKNRAMVGHLIGADNSLLLNWRVNSNNEIEIRTFDEVPTTPGAFTIYLKDHIATDAIYNN